MNSSNSGDKCISELSDYVKEEIENVKFIPRLVMNKSTKEFEEVLLDPEFEGPGVCVTESAQALRVKLGAMSVEEREAWRSDALVPNTVPYAGECVLILLLLLMLLLLLDLTLISSLSIFILCLTLFISIIPSPSSLLFFSPHLI
jgi:hypothetical protein